jgi:hypothetical protein
VCPAFRVMPTLRHARSKRGEHRDVRKRSRAFATLQIVGSSRRWECFAGQALGIDTESLLCQGGDNCIPL